MNPLLRLPYSAAGSLATALAGIAPESGNKILRAIRGRRGLLARFDAWAAKHRDERRPLLWMHAPSVGEGLQALPILSRYRERRPDVQIVYTFYSPSAEQFSRTVPADFTDYLPFDTSAAASAVIGAIRPTALVFSKLDVWPLLTEAAAARGVRLGMISATVGEDSARSSRIAHHVLRGAYRRLDAVGAIDGEDAARLVDLGVRRDAVSVTGDTRYDQVAARASSAATSPLVESLRSPRPTVVAGSTWPADETHLLPAWIAARRNHPSARLIIAPHEPHEPAVAAIAEWAMRNGLSCARLSDDGAAARDVVIADRTGVLGDLYALAVAAYVGGGFHPAGLHSVIEPAAFGVPVIYGAPFGLTRDARLLEAAGAARAAGSVADITTALGVWLHPDAAEEAGRTARRIVSEGVGAADRSYALIETLL